MGDLESASGTDIDIFGLSDKRKSAVKSGPG